MDIDEFFKPRGLWQDLPYEPPDYEAMLQRLRDSPRIGIDAAMSYMQAKYGEEMRRQPQWHDPERQSNWYGPPNGVHGTQPGWEYGPWGNPDELQYGLTFRDWRGSTRCRITAEFLRRHDTPMVYGALQRKGVPFPDLHIPDRH